MKSYLMVAGAGFAAGAVAGLFGAGGGMILVPLLTMCHFTKEEDVFPTSLSIILPICVTTLIATAFTGGLAWKQSVPYLLGSAIGGLFAGSYGQRIPLKWLHRTLGILILWGGIRYLC